MVNVSLTSVYESQTSTGRRSWYGELAGQVECGEVDESRPLSRSSALSYPGAKSPQRELSLAWNIRSLELSLLWNFCSSGVNVPGTFVPWNIRSCGTFVPREGKFQELSFI